MTTLPHCYRCGKQPCECKDGNSLYTDDCVRLMNAMEPDSVDLVFGSPPYCDARTYGINAQRGCVEWVEWMLKVSEAASRASKGPVLWVISGVTRKRNYWPACEGLMWEWWKRGGSHQLYRPCVFHRVGIPGSGGKDWFRADWEYVVCLKRPGQLAWADNTACGHAPRWAPGGEMSHRISDGTRVNQWGKSGDDTASGVKVSESGFVRSKGTRPSHRKIQTRRKKDGSRPGAMGHDGMHNQEQDYQEPALANPGNLLTGVSYLEECQAALDVYERGDVRSGKVGGGLMGDNLAHGNEAPFPEWLAEVFVCSCCPEGGTVLDPFVGSGTTLAVAKNRGRRGIGIDIRESQVEIAANRLRQNVLF